MHAGEELPVRDGVDHRQGPRDAGVAGQSTAEAVELLVGTVGEAELMQSRQALGGLSVQAALGVREVRHEDSVRCQSAREVEGRV
ncbi:hypothetical protein GCM10017557_34470 [Streptomyces aurantiacus]|uniref:Uncharacterized protein n=1 Tax=Streptomyces aurantiacus TaxID=47760 RepID=A0A7G1NZL2_9ACTN|nr:hypothetical protein GCM10017557_34470 [Streptomyces aurantiacus]